MVNKPPLVAIVGPTASGKTEVSIELAEEFHGEIVSADSRQVYRGMDVGTNKATAADRARVPHHLLDMVPPTETYTLAEFQGAARAAIAHIQDRGRLPFLVGGTGLYIQSIVDNLQIPKVPPQHELREELERLSLKDLQERFKSADPVGYANIDTQNRRRLIRAIEVSETAGQPFSSLKRKGNPPYDTFMLGINRPTEVLHTRIAAQVRWRLNNGMIEEVQRLHDEGVSWDHFEAFGLEYRRVAQHIQGMLTRDELVESCMKDLRGFAKRQLTWFKRDRRIKWIETEDDAEGEVSDWLVARTTGRPR